MRVAFDSRPSGDIGGVGRYARCLLRALRATATSQSEIIETHQPRKADVFHAPWMQGAILRSPCPMVVTLHDLSPLKRPSERLRMAALPRLRHLAVQRASNVIVPTRTVAADAVARLDLAEDRITVIPEAPDPAFYPREQAQIDAVRERFGLPERYLVSVGCMQRPQQRKHVAKLVQTRRQLPLVLVGPTSMWAKELEGVRLTGQVSDEQLAAIYSGAHALLLASGDEGFGLPGLEALACGTKVAAFDRPVLREVLGGKASLVELDDFASLLHTAEHAPQPAPGPPRPTWEDAGKATWRVYERALAERGSASIALRRRHTHRAVAR